MEPTTWRRPLKPRVDLVLNPRELYFCVYGPTCTAFRTPRKLAALNITAYEGTPSSVKCRLRTSFVVRNPCRSVLVALDCRSYSTDRTSTSVHSSVEKKPFTQEIISQLPKRNATTCGRTHIICVACTVLSCLQGMQPSFYLLRSSIPFIFT
jgi:hypothetical protein